MRGTSGSPSRLRKSLVVLVLYGLGLGALAATCLDRREAVAATAALVEDLGLSDLALFTEARYTRHLSQADLHAAFQDHPMSLDHFPSGSLVAPVWRRAEADPKPEGGR